MISDVITKLEGAYSENTLRAYRSDFAAFERFCYRHGYDPFPASEASIAAWVAALAEERKRPATIKRYVASIGLLHDYGRFQNPTKGIEVKLALRRANRSLGTNQRQAAPINRALLNAMIETCDDSLHGIRDRLLLRFAYETARRRGELVSLLVEDIQTCEGGSTSILLKRSKTDCFGSGTLLTISPRAAEVLEEWLSRARITEGPVLRGIKGAVVQPALHPSQIARIFKKRAILAGLPGVIVAQISGHSSRVGRAQDLLLNGATLPQIMAQGGWKKIDTAMRYCERAAGTQAIYPDFQ